MCAMNQFGSEDRLSKALRRLAQESARNAPPDLALGLAGAFRRHHRRLRVKNSAIVMLATGCLFSTVWFFSRLATPTPPTAHGITKQPAVADTVASKEIAANAAETNKTVKQARRRPPSFKQTQAAARETRDFLPLPSYDPSIAASNDLQIIRVQMPIQDLRLVGAPVNAAMPNRQVLADFVVGQDGTPYAVRLIQ